MRLRLVESVIEMCEAKICHVIVLFVLLGMALSGVSYVGKEVQTGTRAYISGESEWQKAQKESSINLLQYVRTEERRYYKDYLKSLDTIVGDRTGREALMTDTPDIDVAKDGFSSGDNDTRDLDSMIWVFMYFRNMELIDKAVSIWEGADEKVDEIVTFAAEIDQNILNGGLTEEEEDRYSDKIIRYNQELTIAGNNFSEAMSEASRSVNFYTFLVNVFLSSIFIIFAAYYAVSFMRQLRTTNSKLFRSEYKFRNVLYHSRDVIYQINIGADQYDYVSESVKDMLGIDAQQIMKGGPEMVLDRVHPDDRARMKKRQQQNEAKKIDEVQVEDSEFRVKRGDGEYIWVNNKRAIVRDVDGEPIAIVGNVRDISAHREQMEKLDKSLTEKQTLLAEIHHRVKNNLAIVSSLIELQKDEVADELKPAFSTVQSRIKSIALIHEKLYENTIFSDVELAEYLRELSAMLSDTYYSEENDISIDLDLEDVKVDMTLAVPVGLICNELINNSFKHAFSGNKGGKVTISLKDLGGFVEVSVSDTGNGLPTGFTMENSQSLGMTLLQVLTQQVRGEIKAINDDGARFVLTFPAEHQDNKKAKKKTGS